MEALVVEMVVVVRCGGSGDFGDVMVAGQGEKLKESFP